jgi:endonuclease/exonuclease/phosphatase family metal-dependent hydrolase
MVFKVATFNVENMFTRPNAMAENAGREGQDAIDQHAELNEIINRSIYTKANKDRLLVLDQKYGFSDLNAPANAFITLQKIRGQLFTRSQTGVVTVVPNGRGDWTGWFELRREDIVWESIQNTARVIYSLAADVLVCVEAENRPTLDRFNEKILGGVFNNTFKNCMLIDGNDQRGIDLGIFSNHEIVGIRSHVDDRDLNGERIFSRDSPEYGIRLPGGELLVVIAQHFKSKRGGNSPAAISRRRAQAERAAAISRAALQHTPFVIVAGDFNDTPSNVLKGFNALGFEDIQGKFSYPNDRPGTFGTGTATNKIDYLLMSPQLLPKLVDCGIERRGTFAPNTWKPFPEVTGKAVEASDHHALWASFEFDNS